MNTKQDLLKVRIERLKKVLTLEKPDKTPVILQTDSFCAKHMGVKLSDFVADKELSCQTILNSLRDLGDVDGTSSSFFVPELFPLIFLSKIKLPGVELPDDMLWQLEEAERMTVDDYDTIINKGWQSFFNEYVETKLDTTVAKLLAPYAYGPEANKNIEDEGIMVYAAVKTGNVPELISGARSMPKFMRDLFKMPDKVEAALDIIQKDFVDGLRQKIRAAKAKNAEKHFVVFISPARGASEFFSPKLWERFVWNYLKDASDAIIEEGGIANIHIDSNWERDLDYFKAFPKGKVVLETDGATDIYKIKEKLGDIMCIKGDVPAGLLTLGNPDEVYNYCTKLIRDMGNGFILSSGCSIPPNAKVENVKAMVAAASGK